MGKMNLDEASRKLESLRDMSATYARITTQYVIDGDIEGAKKFAKCFEETNDLIEIYSNAMVYTPNKTK